MENVSVALKQIEWARYREGTYSGKDPLLIIQSKLRNIRKGEKETLNSTDIQTLIKITDASIKHIGKYEYGSNTDSEGLRQFAMEPLFKLRTELIRFQGVLNGNSA